jgi:uncharacterized FlaG/YvyC family protein
MSELFSSPLNAAAHPDDAVNGLKANIFQRAKDHNSSAVNPKKLDEITEPSMKASNVAISFTYDVATKSLHVVMTDNTSGKLVRKMSYSHFPASTHRTEQLHGLLLDQMA